MTQLDKVQLAIRNGISSIGSGPSRRSFIAASMTAGALSFFPRDSFGFAVPSAFSELSVHFRGEEQNIAIRPFRINFPNADLADLRRRIVATRWPECETVSDATQGAQLATMQKLANYWATDYDWRKVEARLNALPQFVTKIDGLDIHFIHVRSKNANALPVVITHGWPGSIIEQLKVIGPLTDPAAYGGIWIFREAGY
jgi:hypothetical protein